LNTFVVKTADAFGLIPRWHGLHAENRSLFDKTEENLHVLLCCVTPCKCHRPKIA
jgi:hypothetical protein